MRSAIGIARELDIQAMLELTSLLPEDTAQVVLQDALGVVMVMTIIFAILALLAITWLMIKQMNVIQDLVLI